LADCTLVTFDEPGTGLAAFDPDAGLDVSALADMAQGVADQLLPGPYFLAGASMGGLITFSSTAKPIRASHIYPVFGRVMSGFGRLRRAGTCCFTTIRWRRFGLSASSCTCHARIQPPDMGMNRTRDTVRPSTLDLAGSPVIPGVMPLPL
jgi:hypothetical protein